MWKPEDTTLLRDYNAKAKGKLVEFLKSQCPPVLGTNIEEVALEAKSCSKIILPPYLFLLFLAETLRACQDKKRNEGHICKKKHLHKALKTNFVVCLFSLDTIMEMTLPKRSANVSKSNDTFV